MRVPYALIVVLLAPIPSSHLSTVSGQGPGVEMANLSAEGIVKGVWPRALQVTVGEEEWFITVPEKYQDMAFEASATPGWLQPGMPVRFSAKAVMERRRREIVIKDPVSDLTIVPVPPNVGMNLYPEQDNDQRRNLFSRRQKEVKKKRSNEPVETPFLVIGKLVENKAGKLRVVAGIYSLRLELAEKAQISVQWHDVRWVRPGDKIELAARYLAGRRGRAQGTTMTVTAANVLDVEKKAVRGRRKPSGEEKSDDLKKADKDRSTP